MSAVFVTSNADYRLCPPPQRPEYAFIGRSNVGKSSLINALLGQPGLAKTSQKPGKTQLINHFLVSDAWYLVDLPGYGWAKTSKTNRDNWDAMIRAYLLERPNLVCTFVLLDSRHEPQRVDLDFLAWLGENHVPFTLVFTKADKQSPTRTQVNLDHYRTVLRESWETLPPDFVTSSVSKAGKEELMQYINQLNAQLIVAQ